MNDIFQRKADFERFIELSDRFKTVAKRRKKLDFNTREDLLDRAIFDQKLFAKSLTRLHGSTAYNAINAIANFLADDPDGARKMIDKALSPRPAHIPSIPAEHLKRKCQQAAAEMRSEVIAAFDIDV